MTDAPPSLHLIAVPGIPLIETGDDLATLLITALERAELYLQAGDVLAVTSKVVSKAEGRWANLEDITPGAEALRLAALTGKDAREMELVLNESVRVSRIAKGVLIVEHKLGFTCANAGIDRSNTRPGSTWRLLLPTDPDASARALRARLSAHFGAACAVVITDSHGRPFRIGTVGFAIGAAGLPSVRDLRGQPDLFGQPLSITQTGLADEIAAAAGLLTGQAAEGLPAIILRGLAYPADEKSAAAHLIRPADQDLFT